jgi:hypothetical protein
MKSLSSRLLWSIVAVSALVPIIYFIYRLSDLPFRDSAMGNWFATMIGALIGILFALEINRVQQAAQEKKECDLREKEERDRKVKILALIKKELDYNRTALLARQPNKEEGAKRVVLVNRLKDELWNAFSDGGELQWIKDVQLLDFIATAYYHVRAIIFLEEKYFEATHFPGMQVQKEKYPKDYILEYLTATDPEVLKHIEEALQEIDKGLTMQ